MKRILVLWLAAMLAAVQPCYAVVMVGFGQEVGGGGGGPIAFPVAATSDSATSTSDVALSVPVPSGTASGDCIIFVGSAIDFRFITPPAGVTQIATYSGYANVYVWYKKAGASESAYAFTVNDPYNYATVVALRVTGAVCDGTGDFTVTYNNSGSSTDVATAANITTPQNDMVVLWAEMGDTGFTADSINRGGATERADVNGGKNGSHWSVWSEPIATASTVTGAQITRSGWSGYGAFSIGIKTAP